MIDGVIDRGMCMTLTVRIRSPVDADLVRATRFRQAVLKSAFEGRL